MKKIGITGGIGSGKSTICRVFELLGIPVYSADKRAKSLMDSDLRLKAALTDLLGKDVYEGDSLNRKMMAGIIFSDASLLTQVNALVHPAVLDDFNLWLKQQDSPYVLHEAAILFESNFYRSMDQNIVISAPLNLRIQRVVSRDKVTTAEVQQRIENQWPEEALLKMADHVIINDDREPVIPQILHIHQQLTNQLSA